MAIRLSRVSLSSLFFLTICFYSSLSFSHSAMFPDSFKFDNTNEGRETLEQGFNKVSALSADCIDGRAGEYPCRNIDLLATLTPSEMGSNNALLNDIWGWTDPVTGREVAIIGRENGTSFVDVTDGRNPVFLGFLPTHGNQTGAWRDIKIFQDHAFIVADSSRTSIHGMQIFDLSELFNVTQGSTLAETAHFADFGRSHNIAINEDSGFAYVVGSDSCSGGLYMVDISTPTAPSFAGCFSADGYTHDAQCVIYQGPDERYTDAEICLGFNEDALTVVDVSDKNNPAWLSRTVYPGVAYTHQGWFFNDDHQYVIMNDELDEQRTGGNTTSYIFDLSELDAPRLVGRYVSETEAIDHNLYTKGNLVYEANYRAGLRVLGAVDISQGCMAEVAYFDTIPLSNSAQFSGAWSSYIYFPSGNIVVSDIESGLFVLKPDQTAIDIDVAQLPNEIANCTTEDITEPTEEVFVSNGGGTTSYLSLLLILIGVVVKGLYWLRWKR